MRKRLVFGVAVIVVAIGAGFAIKAGKGPAAVPASAAMAANTPDAAASEVPLDFTPNEAARPLQVALRQGRQQVARVVHSDRSPCAFFERCTCGPRHAPWC